MQLLLGIVHHFSKDANVNLSKLYNKDVSVPSLDDIGENLPTNNSLYNDGEAEMGEVMGSIKESGKLNVTLNNGHINPKLKRANNLVSTLFHEKTHLDTKESGVWEHLSVYWKQVNHKSWNQTSNDYKNLMISNIKELIEIAKAGNSQLSKKDNEIIKKEAADWEKVFKIKLGKDYNPEEKNGGGKK